MELLSPMHLLIIFFIALLVFGPKKLPELGKGIGEGFKALREGMKDKSADQANTTTTTPPSNPTNPEVKS